MKKKMILSLFCCGLFFTGLAQQMQFPDYSIAPNFQFFEIDKTSGNILTDDTITLYQYTDANKTVFLDFFTTWCAPCWSYHQSHAFEDLYEQYGPNGTDEVMALGIESNYGNFASLSGTGPDDSGQPTQGNWLAGVPYPIIPYRMAPNANAVNNAAIESYINGFPTICMVCPNRLGFDIGTLSADKLHDLMMERCPTFQHGMMNNALIAKGSNIGDNYFCEGIATPKILLQNVGILDLTSVSFNIELDDNTSTYEWTGNMAQWETREVTLPQINAGTSGTHTYTVTVNTVNGVPDADNSSNSYTKSFNVQIDGVPLPVSSDFDDNYLDAGWDIVNDLLELRNGAVRFNSWGLKNGSTDELTLPLLNLTGFVNPFMKFDVAHAAFQQPGYAPIDGDRLKVRVSTDCGITWTDVYNKHAEELVTIDHPLFAQFVPSSGQWRTETVDLSPYISDKTIVKFVFTGGMGNQIWIDNVTADGVAGIDSHSNAAGIYPNPARSRLYINSSAQVESVEVYNLQGQLVGMENGNVHSVAVGGFAPGVYIVRITTTDGILNQRFVKE